jgi:hypothetical protein
VFDYTVESGVAATAEPVLVELVATGLRLVPLAANLGIVRWFALERWPAQTMLDFVRLSIVVAEVVEPLAGCIEVCTMYAVPESTSGQLVEPELEPEPVEYIRFDYIQCW